MRLPVFQQKTGSLIMQYARQAAAMPAWADICRATDSEQLCCELPAVSRVG